MENRIQELQRQEYTTPELVELGKVEAVTRDSIPATITF